MRGARRRCVDRRIHRLPAPTRRRARDRGRRRLRSARLAAAKRSARRGDGARRTSAGLPTTHFRAASTSSRSTRRLSRCARSWRARSAISASDGVIVALVKPQFEAGRERVGSGGVVRDRSTHRDVLRDVRAAARRSARAGRRRRVAPARTGREPRVFHASCAARATHSTTHDSRWSSAKKSRT